MSELTGTLDPDAVIRALLRLVLRTASADRACRLLREGETWTLSTPDESRAVEADAHATAAALLATSDSTGVAATGTAADSGPGHIVALLGPVRTWLTVPFRIRD